MEKRKQEEKEKKVLKELNAQEFESKGILYLKEEVEKKLKSRNKKMLRRRKRKLRRKLLKLMRRRKGMPPRRKEE